MSLHWYTQRTQSGRARGRKNACSTMFLFGQNKQAYSQKSCGFDSVSKSSVGGIFILCYIQPFFFFFCQVLYMWVFEVSLLFLVLRALGDYLRNSRCYSFDWPVNFLGQLTCYMCSTFLFGLFFKSSESETYRVSKRTFQFIVLQFGRSCFALQPS